MSQLYSHSFSSERPELDEIVEKIKERILSEGDTPLAKVSEKLEILKELTQFEFGKFLLQNEGGIDGIWNHYISYEYPRLKDELKPKSHFARAIIEINGDIEHKVRLDLSKKLVQKYLLDGIALLSVPCGVMAELSTVDYSKISNFKIYGLDLDPVSLEKAKEFNRTQDLEHHTQFVCRDAWDMGFADHFDIILSMGLNQYVSDLKKTLLLYKSFLGALKKDGKLIVSYTTPYASKNPKTEKDFSSLNQEYIRLWTITRDIVKTRSSNLLSTGEITRHLQLAGFSHVEICYSPCKSPNFAIATK